MLVTQLPRSAITDDYDDDNNNMGGLGSLTQRTKACSSVEAGIVELHRAVGASERDDC